MPSAQYPIYLEPDTLLPIRPRAGRRLTPSPRWEPGPTFIPLAVAAPAMLAAGMLAAQSAPKALRLLAGLNVPAALDELSSALFVACLGIIGATLSMLLLASHGSRRPVGGRAWASQHLERTVRARQGWVRRPAEPVVVMRRPGYTMPAITPLPFWDASEMLPPSMLTWQPRKETAAPSHKPQTRKARRSDRNATRKLSSREYLPLLPMPA